MELFALRDRGSLAVGHTVLATKPGPVLLESVSGAFAFFLRAAQPELRVRVPPCSLAFCYCVCPVVVPGRGGANFSPLIMSRLAMLCRRGQSDRPLRRWCW